MVSGKFKGGIAVEVTLSELMELVPEMAQVVRDDIRTGRLPAERKTGMAGRPYVISSETLAQSDREGYRQLAKRLEQVLANKGRSRARVDLNRSERWINGDSRPDVNESWFPLVKMMESQHQMMREMVELLSQELARRNERMDRQADEIQQLSFKLGQAHQEVGRLERQITNPSTLARAE